MSVREKSRTLYSRNGIRIEELSKPMKPNKKYVQHTQEYHHRNKK